MFSSSLSHRLSCAVLLSTLAASNAHAIICTPLNAPPPRYVGDTASDNKCTDDTIQSAVNFVKAAAYACPATIYVTREHTYTSQHLAIDNVGTPLNLVGEGDGVQCGSNNVQICDPDLGCPPPPTAPLVTIDGSASNAFSVLSITGANNITLRYLTIKGATASGDGGGIHFEGTGSLTIDTSSIILNQAGYGAGINFNGTGTAGTDPPATLTLDTNTLILNNTANTSGGGIRIEGDARLFALQPQTLIAFNHAPGGYGGGIEMLRDASAVIGSPGYNGAPVIEYNDAKYGGGLAMLAQQKNYASGQFAYLFSTDPAAPTGIADNTAANTGGGVYLKPYNGTGLGFVTFCAADFRINDNIAQEGSAIYADEDHSLGSGYVGSFVDLDAISGDDCDPAYSGIDPSNYGARGCSGRADCNVINDNIAEDATSNPTTGATVMVQSSGVLRAHRVILSGNHGGAVIREVTDDNTYVHLDNCLLADNMLSGPLLDAYTQGSLDIYSTLEVDNCTLAGNTLGSGAVIHDNVGVIALSDSIIDQPGHVSLSLDEFGRTVNYLLSNDTSTLPTQSGIVQGEPTFVDAAASDYHLQPISLGVDFAPAAGGTDLDGRPRDVDLPSVPNVYGPRDLGAYERQNLFNECGTNDSLFCDGFGQ